MNNFDDVERISANHNDNCVINNVIIKSTIGICYHKTLACTVDTINTKSKKRACTKDHTWTNQYTPHRCLHAMCN